jgi:quercetin dioxygenase-like cupin family protein
MPSGPRRHVNEDNSYRGEPDATRQCRLVHGHRLAGPGDRCAGTGAARAARVSFEPGARTAWHTHPLGQTLHVLHGVGRTQSWGGPVREIRAGDTVWIAPDEKHWHGAAPGNVMAHLAIHEHQDGVHVVWLEKVSDAQYAVEPQRRTE